MNDNLKSVIADVTGSAAPKARTPKPVKAAAPKVAKATAPKPVKTAAPKAAAPKAAKAKTPGVITGNVVGDRAAQYHRDQAIRTASGAKAIDSNDEIAQRLRGKTLDQVYSEAAKTLGVTIKSLQEKYGHLNPGMQRMNLGNRIRGTVAASSK